MFIAKNNDLIIMADETREGLEGKLTFMVYTSIEETEDVYVLVNGTYMTEADALEVKKQNKHNENAEKANDAIINGYVVYKEAQFETDDGTNQNLTNKRNMCILRGETSAQWLSKDDKVVEMLIDTISPIQNDDFIKLGTLIENYKNTVWMDKYMDYKQQIDDAETAEEVDGIEIDYGSE